MTMDQDFSEKVSHCKHVLFKLKLKLRKLEQAKTWKMIVKNIEWVAIDSLHLKASDVNKFAAESKAKKNEVDKLLGNRQ